MRIMVKIAKHWLKIFGGLLVFFLRISDPVTKSDPRNMRDHPTLEGISDPRQLLEPHFYSWLLQSAISRHAAMPNLAGTRW